MFLFFTRAEVTAWMFVWFAVLTVVILVWPRTSI